LLQLNQDNTEKNTMIDTKTVKFLKDLGRHNDREWFQANRKSFDAAQDNMIAFAGYLIGKIGEFDDEVAMIDPKTCVMRIYRDVRFSKDKSPYKSNFAIYISPGGRKAMNPGYYFHLEPGKSFIAAGRYGPEPAEVLKIRNAIVANTDEFLSIVESKGFRKTFELRDERLKNAPKGFDPEHKAVEYLKMKGCTAFKDSSDDDLITSDEFPRLIVKKFKETFPLISFLRKAVAG